jgi:antitoxin VapB
MVEYKGRKVEMSLNIKNEETHRLVQKLARLTGESMTAAVDKAVRERLERVRGTKNGGLAERLLKIGRECAAHLKEPYRSIDHGEMLYDEKGLPK